VLCDQPIPFWRTFYYEKVELSYRTAVTAAWVYQKHGFWNLTFEEWACGTMKPIQANRERATRMGLTAD
jgi:hypothetical protein